MGFNSDGANPAGQFDFIGQHPVWDGGASGGTSGNGTVFAVNTDGTGFTNLHNFPAAMMVFLSNSDGAQSVRRFDFIGQHPVWDGSQVAAVRTMARCSQSTPMAQVLRPCIVSLAGQATELTRRPD